MKSIKPPSSVWADNVNANIYAMRTLQKEMAGEWEKAGIRNEDDVIEFCRDVTYVNRRLIE